LAGFYAYRKETGKEKGLSRIEKPFVNSIGSGGWTRTNDLRVMSPTSCHCSTPHRMAWP
jgi:hypothetical protein